MRAALLCLLLSCILTVDPQWAAAIDPIPIPELSLWESNMIQYGLRNCQTLTNLDTQPSTLDQRLASTYYDAERVYYQIAAYTGNPTWKSCAGLGEKFYRDQYVLPNNGSILGYWLFTGGLRMDFQQSQDATSKAAVLALSQNAAYAVDGTPLGNTAGTTRSREVAYVLVSYLDAEAVGAAPRARKAQLLDQALGHIDQWFISKTALFEDDDGTVRPGKLAFMVGLTMKALIQAHEASSDPRIPPAIVAALDGLWNEAWIPSATAFYYKSTDPTSGAPDLNLLIAPAYSWMYLQTGDTRFRDRGDQIFAGGVRKAFLDGSKQFNQNYLWSINYVEWRRAADTKYSQDKSSPAPPKNLRIQ